MIRKIINKCIDIFNKFFILLRIIICSLVYKNRAYLFGIPTHGNLGDQAILLGEEKFLTDNLRKTKIIEVESSITKKFNKLYYITIHCL